MKKERKKKKGKIKEKVNKKTEESACNRPMKGLQKKKKKSTPRIPFDEFICRTPASRCPIDKRRSASSSPIEGNA
jgi:hypothetical protein